MNFKPTDQNLAQKINANCLCTGCGLCQSISAGGIKVGLDPNGYLRPSLTRSLTPEEQVKFDDVCPGSRIEHDLKSLQSNYEVIWGPLLNTREGYAADSEIRYQGSSGGVISALAIYLLESGKVDFVLHTIVSSSNPLLNTLQVSRSRSDVLSACGSRYSPSAPLIDIENYLAQPERFVFIGRPCDVAALHNYARIDPRIAQKVAYTISFMCAGIPSLKGTTALLKQSGLTEMDVKSLKYRGQGWPGSMIVETLKGDKLVMDYGKSWGFLSKYLQFRCKVCPDGIGEFADISCGDAWYLKDGKPDFSDRDGRSVVMSRTGRGEQLILDCIQAGYLTASSMKVDDLNLMQPYQAIRKKLVPSRILALKVLGVQTPKYENLQLEKAARQTGIKVNIQSFLGTFGRVFLHTSFETPQLQGIWKIISSFLSFFIRHPKKD